MGRKSNSARSKNWKMIGNQPGQPRPGSASFSNETYLKRIGNQLGEAQTRSSGIRSERKSAWGSADQDHLHFQLILIEGGISKIFKFRSSPRWGRPNSGTSSYAYTWVHICIRACLCLCTRLCIRIWICVWICICICTCIRIWISRCTYVYESI